ncbi:MAG: acyl-CoA thioesterase [Fluviicola sp.]|nr:acyl-CoA thioesterase [Fluviicola sp.]
MKFQHKTQIRVRYSETDQMGYCYYGNYAQYLEVGRVELLRKLGMSYKELEDEGYMLPVSDFSISYKQPAFYDDELTIETTITKVSGVRIVFDYLVKNKTNETIVEATTTLVFISKETKKPIQPPAAFLEIFNQQ